LGPILQEFKVRKNELRELLTDLYSTAMLQKGFTLPAITPGTRVTVQGGIGTWQEHNFLLDYYGMDSTGWGSPFLLVPEVTNVDDDTLKDLASASESDYFLS